MFSADLQTPYYGVVFSSTRTSESEGYQEMDKMIYAEEEKNPGF